MRQKIIHVLIVASLFLAVSSFVWADSASGQTSTASASEPRTGEQINWRVISAGGTAGSSAAYQLGGTAGQTAVGGGTSASYGMSHGYWLSYPGCDCIPGEADGSGSYNLLDVTHIINYLYKNGPAPIPYALCSGDADCDCGLNILDVTYIINYLYKNGPAPCSCESWVAGCGPLQK